MSTDWWEVRMCSDSRQAGTGSLCVHNCSFWMAAQTVSTGSSEACTLYPHLHHHSALACNARNYTNKFLWKPIKRKRLKNIYCIKYEDGNALFTLVLKIIWSIVLKQKDETGMCKYQKAGPRMEHFKWVDNPLIVWAQERANVLAWRVAKPLSYTSPAPLLTDHLKPPLICHNLEHKPMLL